MSTDGRTLSLRTEAGEGNDNTVGTPAFNDLLATRRHRRHVLHGGVLLGSIGRQRRSLQKAVIEEVIP